MNKIRFAVIGVGYLGRFHAQKLKALENTDLIAVCDVKPEASQQVSRELDVSAYLDYKDLFGRVDAVCIAATTNKHYDIAKDCIENGLHVLVEKPMTETLEQARELVALADKHKIKFQIGHLERFNSARLALDNHLVNPQFIESKRLAPFNPRGTDVNVILDLMIHDIDIIQHLVNRPIKSIEAQGAKVLSNSIDIANARITFDNECVANVTASRVSFKTERKTHIFQPNSCITIDFHHKKFSIFQKGEGEMYPGIPDFSRHETVFEKGDALMEEIKAFADCIINDTPPLVTGLEGCRALETAEKITQLIHDKIETANQVAHA